LTDKGRRPFAGFLFLSRMTGAVRLHSPTYEEVYQEGSATLQGIAVVVLASLATGIGVHVGFGLLLMFTLSLVISWCLPLFTIFIVGTVFFAPQRSEVSMANFVRTLGFAQAPFVLTVFGIFFPNASFAQSVFLMIITGWVFSAMCVAVRQTLGYSSWFKSALVVGVGFVPWILLDVLIVVAN
jgi:hypothetical protein